jgi:hypothetical protein
LASGVCRWETLQIGQRPGAGFLLWYRFLHESVRIMIGEASPFLSPWSNFYVIVGSSAGALTGLQFVVMALVADAGALGGSLEVRAFGTPTIVHFCFALVISGIVNAPWHELSSAALALGLCGAAGVVYASNNIRHARHAVYSPDAADWFWYAALPLSAYTTLLVTATVLDLHPARALFVVAGVSLVLLFISIHNAWDTVTYVTLQHRKRNDAQEDLGPNRQET